MGTKWSAFPVTTTFAPGDSIVGLVGGLNKKFTRATFLAAQLGDAIQVQGNNSEFNIDGSGNVQIVTDVSHLRREFLGTNQFLQVDGINGIRIDAIVGMIAINGNGGANITFITSGTVSIAPGAGQPLLLFYAPNNPAFWVVPPTDIWNAIDRIAAVVSAGGATPIP